MFPRSSSLSRFLIKQYLLLQGKGGDEDCQYALACLYDVMLTVCKVMSPFTPFFTEKMYQNLVKCMPAGSMPSSIHFCEYPEPRDAVSGDKEIQESVDRMQRVIELARQIREQKKRPIKMPVKVLTVVHPDQAFLEDISGGVFSSICLCFKLNL